MSKGKVLLVLYKGNEHAQQEQKLLGCLENELGIREFIESQGYELVCTDDKDPEPSSTVDKELQDAEIVITTPFFPAYITRERINKAPKLKMCITAGVGSDHVDLDAANERKIAVTEVTGSNVVSVAEHVLMTMLVLVRNFVPAHEQVIKGEWDIAGAAKDEYDLEDKVIATVGAGRIGYRVLERLIAFNPKKLLYYDYQDLPKEAIDKLNQASKLFNGKDNIVERVENLEDMVGQADLVTINCPLHEKSKGLFNKDLISKMKDGAWLVNTARGAICVAEDVAAAVKSGKLRGYGGDVWYPQPAPKDHPWRQMQNKYGAGNAMTPHVSGTSLDAQARYADGVKSILNSYFSGKHDYLPKDVIVIDGDYATKSYGQRK
ncbi:DEHA2A01408p [Debaryomyces hansenii CBS767]|jgi:formate dehydrogenase|uniref:Formate dehydrogenase n=1 Tax=Debaryomyces hansenii (strain ATCC 36239 / CBS 767 / BCRC 21394 / JCM 1990 / NBRC 0083 / IGC 2968) TaxID=284592 RepID=Q6BZG9_DEBHA|nr:DEHA2A01408p [Debaryomyces hansenii CBS767]CAG84347.1 DEHA2A01408p [Debaryomyces hansenii CBS767]|eukprot:XP_456400.1 DEHA2A01408p [Debaryomyces hansenii CBS767]